VSVTVRVEPSASGQFTRLVGDQVVGRPGEGLAVLDFPACDAAVTVLVAFGGAVEVLEPADVRERLAEIGRQLSALYR
jgi:predicted DNA-binding transcriptional regulator YafY